MLRSLGIFIPLVILAAGAASAQDRVCIEEVSGVCLKYAIVEKPEAEKPAKPAAPAQPRQLAPGEAEEGALRLNRSARRDVQRGLRQEGFYNGGIDGALGPQSRRAIAAWQRSRALRATGYLTDPQVRLLREAAASAVAVTTPTPSAGETQPAPAAAAPSGAPIVKSHFNDYNVKVSLTAEEAGPNEMKLTFSIDADGGFRDSCNVPRTGKFTCYLRQTGWSQRIVSGTLPNVLVTKTRTMANNRQIYSEREEFTLW